MINEKAKHRGKEGNDTRGGGGGGVGVAGSKWGEGLKEKTYSASNFKSLYSFFFVF